MTHYALKCVICHVIIYQVLFMSMPCKKILLFLHVIKNVTVNWLEIDFIGSTESMML